MLDEKQKTFFSITLPTILFFPVSCFFSFSLSSGRYFILAIILSVIVIAYTIVINIVFYFSFVSKFYSYWNGIDKKISKKFIVSISLSIFFGSLGGFCSEIIIKKLGFLPTSIADIKNFKVHLMFIDIFISLIFFINLLLLAYLIIKIFEYIIKILYTKNK